MLFHRLTCSLETSPRSRHGVIFAHAGRELRFCCCCVCEDILLCDIAAAEEYADSGTVLSKRLIRLPASQSYTWGRDERLSDQLA